MSFFHRRNENQSNARIHNGAQLITVMHPKSPISEQFRTLRTNINFMAIDHPIKTLALTSANASEGKSTVTDNLAIVWAQTGQKVLLVDADLRRSTLHRTFNLDNREGLTTILTSRAHTIDLNTIIQPSGIDNLSLLPSGPTPPNPAELLSSQRMKDFLKAARERYDMVIVDVPPMLVVTDTQVISRDLDAVVLVVKQGQTQKLGAKRAVELLKMAHANLLGYVMNDVVSDGSAGYGYGYGYGNDGDDE
ncbi:CpsD/CapB family tyrosine-protein kinase [Limosilactobacillus panis]|uniref:Tyrosine-protein kinase CpsD n=1 Tax=Limosilactobacillus panis TaxID=47493 RepID=A0ABT7VQU4_9LACO|nr:CpsD/CapB family tyrosine-protein kinase [Limosilactobacillus panis]MDM8334506.1 CpsD/CapB family tyrosine-protein kinase [Limosilactobacillus panis]